MIGRAMGLGTLLLCLTLAEGRLTFAEGRLTFAEGRLAAAEPPHLDTFVAPGGEGYFALRLVPNIVQPRRRPHDIVVVFDTSASQAGVHREKALATLDSLLESLDAEDRVRLLAVDVDAVSLTPAFLPPASTEMRSALAALGRRVPLGSTDMAAAYRAICAAYGDSPAAGRDRTAVYLGDGMSAANLVASNGIKSWAEKFASAHISITSFVVGPRVNLPLLGALAKTTGGMLVVDDETLSGREAGLLLADAAHGAVVWPERIELPKRFHSAYFRGVPPLRFDRDTVMIGGFTPAADASATADIHLEGALAGRPVTLTWRAEVEQPNDDQAYLANLVSLARRDGGVSLPTMGGSALDELRQLAHAQTRNLVKLGQQAVATGDFATARRLAVEATRLDPTNPAAQTIHRAVARIRSSESIPATATALRQRVGEGDDDAEAGALEDGVPPTPDATDGDLLNDVERQQRVFEGFLRTEVRNALNYARGILSADPEGANQLLKIVLDKVRRSAEVRPELRAQLVDQLESGLRAASRQITLKTELALQQQQIAAEGEARERINRELFLQQQKVDQLMARFEALMDEERFRDAEIVANIAEEIEPGRAGLRGAELTARMVGYTADMVAVRDMRHKGFVDAAFQIELSHVPTADEPPILYPDPEVWQLLTERRKKYKAVDVKQNSPNEQKILAALDEKTEIDFADQPLLDVVDYLKQRHAIEIQLDNRGLTDAGVGSDTPITRSIKNISLRSALKLVLSELDLTYVIRNEVLMITSKTEAENMLVTKVYPVADLVIRIQSPRMMGGRGGRF